MVTSTRNGVRTYVTLNREEATDNRALNQSRPTPPRGSFLLRGSLRARSRRPDSRVRGGDGHGHCCAPVSVVCRVSVSAFHRHYWSEYSRDHRSPHFTQRKLRLSG